MKKIFTLLALFIFSVLALTSCLEEIDSNPQSPPPPETDDTLEAPPGERGAAPEDTALPAGETQVIVIPKITFKEKQAEEDSTEEASNLETHFCIKDGQVPFTYYLYEPGSGNYLCELYFSHTHQNFRANNTKEFCRAALVELHLMHKIEQGFKCSCFTHNSMAKITKITEEDVYMCGKLYVKKPKLLPHNVENIYILGEKETTEAETGTEEQEQQ